jgi:polysaccharide deacetylase 2 family uncharacterized protein YibQ
VARRRITSIRPLLTGLWVLSGLLLVTLALLILWPARAPAGVAPGPGARHCTPARPCVAVVIDDVGRDLRLLTRLLALDADLTFSVLPHALYTQESLEAIRAREREVMLHLPMRPRDTGKVQEEAVVVGMDGPLETAVLECLRQVPDAVGVNNHMGSAISESVPEMRRVLAVLQGRGLWFLDSRTTAATRICEVARELKMPCIRRDVFLDDRPSAAAVESGLNEALRRARRRGWAIAVGHVRPVTVRVLGEFLQDREINVVRLSRVVAGPAT